MNAPDGDAVSRPRGRWRYVVKPSFQFRYGFWVFLAMAGLVLFVGWNAYFAVNRDLLGELKDPRALTLFHRVNGHLLRQLWFYMAVVVVVAVFLSHKVAGPLYRFEKSAEEIGRGRLRHRIQLRRGDELQDLQEVLNRMVESLQRKVAGDRRRRDEALQKLASLRQELSSASSATERTWEELEGTLSQLTEDFDI